MTAYLVTRAAGVVTFPAATEVKRDGQLLQMLQVSGDGRNRRTLACLELSDEEPMVLFGEPAEAVAAFRGVYVLCAGQLYGFPNAMYRLQTDAGVTVAELYGVVDIQGLLETIGGPIEAVENDFQFLGMVRLGNGVVVGNGQQLPQGGGWAVA